MPCCDKKGLDKDEIKFLDHIRPELKRLADAFPNPEVARRFTLSIDRDRPNLPPGKVLVQTHKAKVMDKDHVASFGCYCCRWDWETGECVYLCCPEWDHKKALLLAAGAAAAVYAACRLFAKEW
jgi:hypothetical protein